MDISALTDIVVKHWPMDVTKHPRLAHIPALQHPEFAIRIILLKQQAVCGRLAEEVLKPMMKNGAPIDNFKLRAFTRDFLMNALRLAAAAGISPSQLVDDITNLVGEEPEANEGGEEK